jgi:hypothetical protein
MPRENTGRPVGRPKGTINKFSAAVVEKAASTGSLPHELLLAIGRGDEQWEKTVNPETGEIKTFRIYPTLDQRIDCLKACSPYFAPKLAQVQHKGVQKSADQVSDDELLRIATDIEPIDGSGRDDVIEG